MAKNSKSNITVFRKRWNINIGVVIFGAIFVYLIVAVLLYLTGNHISVYEVREGSILKDTAYTGVAVREETVIKADKNGYVNYFALEGSKVGAMTKVYSLSDEKLDFDKENNKESAELSSEERNAILIKTQDFSDNFRAEQFGDVYSLKNNIETIIESKSNQTRQDKLMNLIESGTKNTQVYNAASAGIIIYHTDGYETIKTKDVTEDLLMKTDYAVTDLKNNSKVTAGDPVYKLITDDLWTIVIRLDEQTAKELKETKRVRVRFSKDRETERAGFSIQKRNGVYYGILAFDSAMIRYAQERYLDIELILEDESGLKIPKSAVIEKDFYIVPESYLTQGGNSKETGVLVDIGKGDAKFQKVDVYYKDTETGMVYLDPNVFDGHETLLKTDSKDTYKLEKTKPLKGVYNINKGYAVFKQINILCESEEYYIVKSGSDYGLSNYDHIALVGEDVRENDIVF